MMLVRLRRLTGREREVLALRIQGTSIREIARRLVVEERTVKFHLGNVYAKLRVDAPSQGARQLALARYRAALEHLQDLQRSQHLPAQQRRAPLPVARTRGGRVRMAQAPAPPPLPAEAGHATTITPPPPQTPQRGPGLPVPWARVLTAAAGRPRGQEVEDYLARGGYGALRVALARMTPQDVIDVVSAAKLVGRGGAGYPTGLKWAGAARGPAPRYLVVNADESEPGTFGNRYAIDADPHMLLEGMLLCCYAAGISRAYIYIRGENRHGAAVLERAIAQAYERGFLGPKAMGRDGFGADVFVVRGAGAYICGEETALMESLEGRRGQPRIRPPFPTEVGGGLFGRPTVVNNVETLMCVPHIIARGPEWFASVGTPACPGPKLYSISGHVNRPGVYELPMGVTLRDLIYTYAGGMLRNQRLKAVSPGALACQFLTEDDLDVHLDTATLGAPPYRNAIGPVGFGGGGIVVYGDEVDMVALTARIAGFFARESCGKCVPCREGTHWMRDALGRIASGRGTDRDIATVEDVAWNVGGRKTLCMLGDFAAAPVLSALQKFRPDFAARTRGAAWAADAAG
jgi:NADH-quinone oxidoreductase subunit F